MPAKIPYEDVEKSITTFVNHLSEAHRDKVREATSTNIMNTINSANGCDLLGVIQANVERCEILRDLRHSISASKPDPVDRVGLMADAQEIFFKLDNNIVKVLQGHCDCKVAGKKGAAAKPVLKATGTELAAQLQALERMPPKKATEPAKPLTKKKGK